MKRNSRIFNNELEDSIQKAIPLVRANSKSGSFILSRSGSFINSRSGSFISKSDQDNYNNNNNKFVSFLNMALDDLTNEDKLNKCYSDMESRILSDATKFMTQKNINTRTINSIKHKSSGNGFSIRLASSEKSMTVITDCLFLGGRDDASNYSLLRSHGITHILNVAQQLPFYFPKDFVCMKVALQDSVDCKIDEDTLKLVISFLSHIHAVNGKVLIHCISGVSRSVSIVILYLIIAHQIPLKTCYEYILSIRPFIAPNDGFKLQMAIKEISVLGYSSVINYKHWDFYTWNSAPADNSIDEECPCIIN